MREGALKGKFFGYLLVTLTNSRVILPIPPVLKTGVGKLTVGSNPTLSAIIRWHLPKCL